MNNSLIHGEFLDPILLDKLNYNISAHKLG